MFLAGFTNLCFDIRDGKGQAASLLTLKGDFSLSGASAQDMTELITMFLIGLTERSRFAMTLREAETQGQTPDCSVVTVCWRSLVVFHVNCCLSRLLHLHR